MSIKALQAKVGVPADGAFGPATLKAARDYFKLTDAEACHFFGQCYHESGGFRVFSENLNYSAQGLLNTFGKYFTPETAKTYARQPERIANHVYANRMGNRDEASGDGWRNRGRGAIQLTGHDNYEAFANSDPKYHLVHTMPELVATEYAFDSALWFFKANNILPLCKVVTADSVLAVTKKVNGGTNGLAERRAKTMEFSSWL